MTEELHCLPYVPKGAWLEERYVRCGKACHCRLGEEHGTYTRLVWRVRGNGKRQRYVAAEHVSMYQQALELRRQEVARGRWGMRSARAAISRARRVLRAVNERTPEIPRSIGRRRLRPERM